MAPALCSDHCAARCVVGAQRVYASYHDQHTPKGGNTIV